MRCLDERRIGGFQAGRRDAPALRLLLGGSPRGRARNGCGSLLWVCLEVSGHRVKSRVIQWAKWVPEQRAEVREGVWWAWM